MEPLLAAHPAIGAGGADLLRLPGPRLAPGLLFRKGPDGADLHALAAEDALAAQIRAVAARDDLAPFTAIAIADGPVDHQLVAGLNATPAADAAGEVTDDEGVFLFGGVEILILWKAHLLDSVIIRQILKAAIAVFLADQTIMAAAGQKQFHV